MSGSAAERCKAPTAPCFSTAPSSKYSTSGEAHAPRSRRTNQSMATALSGEWLQGVAEVPGALNDPGAGVGAAIARTAAVVALDRPDRQRVHALGGGERLDVLRVGDGGDLRLLRVVVDAVHQRDAHHPPQLGGRL